MSSTGSASAADGGETDLAVLLRSLRPARRAEPYVYCAVEAPSAEVLSVAAAVVDEDEATTVIVTVAEAEQLGLTPSSGPLAWITLTVHSSLEAVGMTAAFASALASNGLTCNVLAGWLHDHLLVPIDDAERALDVLRSLATD